MAIRSLFFDFGGCIDAPGIHTRTLFWRAFLRESLCEEGRKGDFQEAYTRADRRMLEGGEAKALGLKPFNRLQAELIALELGLGPGSAQGAADSVTAEMAGHLEAARPVLAELGREYPLAVISNFTGNLERIMEEFSIRELFASVTESFYVGCSKPDPRIFQAALAKQPYAPAQCLYVGDNPVNDIAPAKALGMKTALIYEREPRECGADLYVSSLGDLKKGLKSL